VAPNINIRLNDKRIGVDTILHLTHLK